MSIRSDLAIESLNFATQTLPKGITHTIESDNGLSINIVDVLEEGIYSINKPQGTYITIETNNFREPQVDFIAEVNTISNSLKRLGVKTTEKSNVLVVGLGNRDITPDNLGPLVTDNIFATRHIGENLQKQIGLENLTPVSSIATGVLGNTGIESAEMIASLIDLISPTHVIVIDALASKSIDRIACTIQISNTGISPGSGVQNKRVELSEQTLGVPVISIGMPTVVDMTTIINDIVGEYELNETKLKSYNEMMVTPREIDLAISNSAKTIALGINKALQPNLTLDEIEALSL